MSLYIMCGVEGLVLIIFLVLLFISRKTEIFEYRSGIWIVFDRIAAYCVSKFFTGRKHQSDQKLKSDLTKLNPGQKEEILYYGYLQKKLSLCIVLMIIGSSISLLISYEAYEDAKLPEENRESRPAYNQEKIENVYELTLGEAKMIIEADTYPIELKADEADLEYAKYEALIIREMLGNNENALEVTENLNLISGIDGFPFSSEWTVWDLGLISVDGVVREVDERMITGLTLETRYKDYVWRQEIEIDLVPKRYTQEELNMMEIKSSLTEAESADRSDQMWNLPAVVLGESAYWRRSVADFGLPLWFGIIAIVLLIYKMSDKDLDKKVYERREEMRKSYSEILQKLSLYMGAGLTVRSAFLKIAQDGNTDRRLNENSTYARAIYEEISYSCREIQAGISEALVYERLGRRTDLQEYIRLGTLLSQNLKKGNSSLLPRLREECDIAAREKMLLCRKNCEEAATKLLLPMMMMLLVVMIMVMLPAFSNMGF